MSGFAGFPKAALEFYAGLEDDNSKAYWQAHKPVYDGQVRAPMEALVADLAPEFGAARLFRPYRDTRFSHDKTPYKTQVAAVLGGVYYVQLSADGLMTGGGMHHIESARVARLRRAVAHDRTGPELERIVAAVATAGFEVDGERLKTMPRGFPKDHPRAELLKHRSLFGWRMHPPKRWLHTAAAADRVREDWRALTPLTRWLLDHVGADGPGNA